VSMTCEQYLPDPGSGHAAAVTTTGELFTWGTDGDGQLGRPRRRGLLRGRDFQSFP
jgi:alpha-tubulin suppressor-like RCC1 family protein